MGNYNLCIAHKSHNALILLFRVNKVIKTDHEAIVWTFILRIHQNGKKSRPAAALPCVYVTAFSAFANFLGRHPHAHIRIHTQYSSAFQITRRRARSPSIYRWLGASGEQFHVKHIGVCMWIVEVSFALLTTHGRLAAERGRWMVGINAAQRILHGVARASGLVLAFCCRLRFIKI